MVDRKKRKNPTLKEKSSSQVRKPDTITLDRPGIPTGPGQKSSEIIRLDRKGVQTGAGEKSSDVKPEPGKILKQPEESVGEFAGRIISGRQTGGLEEGEVIGSPVAIAPTATAAALIAKNADKVGTFAKGLDVVGKVTDKVSKTPAAANFASNAKTAALSSSMWSKAGLGIAAAGTLIGAIGTYPFAGFIKEEALQQLGFGVNSALEAGDLERAQEIIDETNEILNPSAWDKIIAAIPYANVVKELKDFYKAAATKNEQAQAQLDIKLEELSGERETQFAQEQRINDEAKRQRELEQRGLDEEYFRLIREGKFEEAEELRVSQLK